MNITSLKSIHIIAFLGVLFGSVPQVVAQELDLPEHIIDSIEYKTQLELEKIKVDTTQKEHKAKQEFFGRFIPNDGFRLVEAKNGAIKIKIMTYIRYLNQKMIDPTYVNAFGDTSVVQQRQDIQMNKVNVTFKGWLFTEKFKYWVFIWTQNSGQGNGGQVVVGGNLTYMVNKYAEFGAGILSYNGTRSTEGNFPYWHTIDNRLIADEFFRPSYSTGVWATGNLHPKVKYHAMIGNNMSTLGVDAGQLDNYFRTFTGAISYFPSTGEYGILSNFGDFEDHQEVASRVAFHYTRSLESRQGQLNTNAFENNQIRFSDGTSIFAPDVFGAGSQLSEALYQMADLDGGFKYKGFELSGEYMVRWVKRFSGPGIDGSKIDPLFDHGFQVQASYMAIKQMLQFYGASSVVFGQYGRPWEARTGVNFWPFKEHIIRLQAEYFYMRNCPVGALSYPYQVGLNGGVFTSTIIMAF